MSQTETSQNAQLGPTNRFLFGGISCEILGRENFEAMITTTLFIFYCYLRASAIQKAGKADLWSWLKIIFKRGQKSVRYHGGCLQSFKVTIIV